MPDALRNGQVDAVTTDNVILLGSSPRTPGEFKLVGKHFTKEPYGIGVKKGDDDFRDWINDSPGEGLRGRPLAEGVGQHRRQVRR